MADVFFIDAEGGMATIEQTDLIEHKERIFSVRATKYKTVAEIHDWLKAHCFARDSKNVEMLRKLESSATGVPPEEIENPRIFKTVVLDSLSEIETYSNYVVLGIDEDDFFQEDMPVSGWPEFRKNLESVKLLCRAFRDLPMHTIFTCVSTYKQDDRKRMNHMPFLTGQLARAVQGFVGMVGFLVTDSPKQDGQKIIDGPRRLFVQPIQTPGGNFQAKNRYAKFKGAFIDNPTMANILQQTGKLPA